MHVRIVAPQSLSYEVTCRSTCLHYSNKLKREEKEEEEEVTKRNSVLHGYLILEQLVNKLPSNDIYYKKNYVHKFVSRTSPYLSNKKLNI
jgi:nitrate reductase assembly molybdenum cofactor insertion protein NarJ